ncbi:hypothetical protein ETU08_00560 [Apibacter muscae]|uniref:hypothetical protein n=1 Tax=Apibacter muscae TaxID=2509004 RepID=UPI0011AB9125|nr:hypothetical protein [Apibacter muscae]TWP31587.1 hypothetical protein ETU08_00560 [Apibacter muscae]
MNTQENFQSFNIECLNSKDSRIKAIINIWTNKEINPTIVDIDTKKPYTYQGIFEVTYIEYKDSENVSFLTKDIRKFEAFYKLYKQTENKNIRMLIKGCSIENYMVKFLVNTLFTMKLEMGVRVDYSTPTIGIFEEEEDVNQIATVQEQKAYYHRWLKSIEGLPY